MTASATFLMAEPPKESSSDQPPQAEKSAKDETWESPLRQSALEVQLFLDKAGFGPGKLDGRWGSVTQAAFKQWASTQDEDAKLENEKGELVKEKVAELGWEAPLTKSYTISEDDQKLIGKVPDEPKDQAKQEDLPYTSLAELVAEKFHSDLDFLKEMNGLENEDKLSVGDEITVPNVATPFDLSKAISLGKEEDGEASENEEKISMTIKRSENLVLVKRDGELVHTFPISIGEAGNKTPAGDWETVVVKWMPVFRYDKQMLEEGKRSADAHVLPPGPNNPVGIVWMGLSADGIGLHGTPSPDKIGRTRSHGCIRLSNWDALRLGQLLTTGVPVTIE